MGGSMMPTSCMDALIRRYRWDERILVDRLLSGRILSSTIKITGQDLSSCKWAQNIGCPTLIVHSIEDKLIPPKLAKKLLSRIGSRHKKLLYIKGGHASPKIETEQFKEILSFLGVKRELKSDQDISKMSNRLRELENEDWS